MGDLHGPGTSRLPHAQEEASSVQAPLLVTAAWQAMAMPHETCRILACEKRVTNNSTGNTKCETATSKEAFS